MNLSPVRLAQVRNALLVMLGVAVTAAIAIPSGGATLAGSAGTDTSLPRTDSQVTVHGRDQFANLKITVNQTKHLLNQAISVTWTGGQPTSSGAGGRFFENYLQIMQCWGDDDGTNPANPGPPPEQCVQGATNATFGGATSGIFPSGSFAPERLISRTTWTNYDSSTGVVEDGGVNVWRPFKAVDGTVIGVPKDPHFDPAIIGGNYWLNTYFNIVTTNEIAGARTGPNGTGAELFQINTGVESSGLGCGQAVQPVPGGAPKVPRCWLVVVPRGSAVAEDAGTPFSDTAAESGVMTSPLAPAAWRNRIAVPLDFNAVDSPCPLAAQQRRISGSELPVPAVSSWQPTLCSMPGLDPYAYGTVGDSQARAQLMSKVPGTPGMAVVSAPLDASTVDADHPVVYAPLTLSGVVIGFNLERNPLPTAERSAQDLSGVRVAQLNLTPRLIAKLLTQSYTSQVTIKKAPPYPWLIKNPAHMGEDPDFLRFNPEFAELQVASGKNFGGFVMPSVTSDAARQVWSYVLADPEAKAWLDGAPDAWGMKVNPVYATKAAANSTGAAFASPAPETFPKSDPYCYQGPNTGVNASIVPPPLCGTDWLPFVGSFHDAAQRTRQADDGAKIVENPFAVSADQVYQRDTPQVIGSRAMLSITDSASAFQYGVQVARLSRAGDDGSGRTFVAPDPVGLTAGVTAMQKSKSDPAVLVPDPTTKAPSAYPLTALAYAAVIPSTLDATARRQYAAFVAYAAGAGQTPGLLLGQLPPGYAPLPSALRDQAAAAAKKIAANPTTSTPGVPTTLAAAPAVVATGKPPPASTSSSGPPRVASRSAPSSLSYVAETGLPAAPATQAAPSEPVLSAPPVASPSAVSSSVSTPSPPPVLARALTPAVAVPNTRLVLPTLIGLALLTALGALEITKRPRRAPVGTSRDNYGTGRDGGVRP